MKRATLKPKSLESFTRTANTRFNLVQAKDVFIIVQSGYEYTWAEFHKNAQDAHKRWEFLKQTVEDVENQL